MFFSFYFFVILAVTNSIQSKTKLIYQIYLSSSIVLLNLVLIDRFFWRSFVDPRNFSMLQITPVASEFKSPRKKRILPSSPDLLDRNKSTPTSGAFKTTVEKWLQFADRTLDGESKVYN